ncbi:MarR family winged helix-turn-helix transcriptional regulator [Streptococcus parauberis]|uniref:MarR family transcriptional regulator n=1 Tax=Streptococcus parauberis TaxID=1348 RepID=A0A1S1ZRG7_9STRE|nr:MarR family transcriptional regulator [Streptococcus parauberis]MDT2732304.1 MarR family transcriptional regulator [Streptococcus parauberis]OHY30429.1 MarR family transcriptional regulator [Streptococcus parauberis]PCH12394.1 Transcriptional regulator SlyA [Streptococcus parauberis]PNY19053.1 Transcriptional regulator SlyA [Streptococcus parauberis]PNY21259.1 Transcriptional regulator SlyA [Streptococcus parauberis]
MFKIEECLAYFTNKESKLLATELDNRIQPYGLTRVQWMALYHIANNEQISQKQLANLMGSKQPTIAKLLDRMTENGLIQRIQFDKRTNFLDLTSNGREMYTKILPVAERFKNDAVKGIPNEDLLTFQRVMKQMAENIK